MSYHSKAFSASFRVRIIPNCRHGRSHVSKARHNKKVSKESNLKHTEFLNVESRAIANTDLCRFETDLRRSCGSTEMRIPIQRKLPISLTVDVVNNDLPFVTGLAVSDRFVLYTFTVENRLCCDSSVEDFCCFKFCLRIE